MKKQENFDVFYDEKKYDMKQQRGIKTLAALGDLIWPGCQRFIYE